MALDKQIYMYSVDTSDFYYDDEKELYKQMQILYFKRSKMKEYMNKGKNGDISKIDDFKKYFEDDTTTLKEGITKELICENFKRETREINKQLKEYKNKLYELFNKNKGKTRTLDTETFDTIYKSNNKKISSFESTLTRVLGIETSMTTTDIFVVQTFFFDVLRDLIKYGFMYNNEKYIVFTASAGQIRTKKTIFINEKIYNNIQKTLMCGLTLDLINSKGGNNVNKFLAYLALTNSATELCKRVNMKYAIVVDDLETMVSGLVDYIDNEDFSITRKYMDVPISHTDGAGMIIPMKSKTNFMVRAPWIKGLLVSFDFRKFVNEKCGGKAKVKDIYGKEYDIIKDNIQVIFTKSQFKMWKFYDSWQQYLEYFYKYGCEVGMCNEEEKFIGKAKINYQMLQTLTDITDDELMKIANTTITDIKNIGRDRATMLKILGVTKGNSSKNDLQKSIHLYPELLQDIYTREIIKKTKSKVVREARGGRLDIDGKYTFISPDMYAFCEYLFLGHKNPQGLLKNGEVSTNIYKDGDRLDCLRSPSLYREHAVRDNVVNDEIKKWFKTKALYTSVHDLISKILQFDVDGDQGLVVAEETVVTVADRNMKDIVPLYYEMPKAKSEKLDNDTLYDGITTAYSGGNIGSHSNEISKNWNDDDVDLDTIKLLCYYTNFVVDFAKTLFLPIFPKHILDKLKTCSSKKTPYFFKYVKDKTDSQVEPKNNSTVNRLEDMIKNTPIRFDKEEFDKFDYTKLMNNKDIKIDKNVIDEFCKFRFNTKITYKSNKDSSAQEIEKYYVLERMAEIHSNKVELVDMLVEYFYGKKNTVHKKALWEFFGDIIYNNLRNNIDGEKDFCVECGDIVDAVEFRGFIYCDKCSKIIEKENNRKYARESMRRKRNNHKC